MRARLFLVLLLVVLTALAAGCDQLRGLGALAVGAAAISHHHQSRAERQRRACDSCRGHRQCCEVCTREQWLEKFGPNYPACP